MSLLQNICDAIWDAETRTLLVGTPLADPANLLEEICDACWTETTRELTSEPLTLPDYPDVENESPYEQDEAIVTVAATGGSAPVSYSIEAQSTTAGMLKVTGTLNPDATGIYVENGTYNGKPAYERADGAYWIRWDGKYYYNLINPLTGEYWNQFEGNLLGDYSAENSTGTATVAAYEPFAINSSTGEITIADASGLAVGQVWTLTVRATDALLDTDDGTVTVELTAGAGGFFARRYYDTLLAGSAI
jgi:hypothetical protein